MSAKEFREQTKKAKQELDEMHKANLKKPLPNKFVTTPIFTKWQKDAILVGLSLGLIVTSAVLISNWFDYNRLVWQSPVTFRTPVYAEVRVEAKELLTTDTKAQVVPEPSPTASPSPTPTLIKKGKVSYYSHSGCLGCGDNQVTASGEKFDENAMTLAIPAEWRNEIPMGTKVRVTNLDNGIAVIARVNDTGGFLKYNRIADLSLGLYQAIEAKTDVSTIKLEII